MKTALIIGSTGLIGSQLLNILLKAQTMIKLFFL
jgi:1-deoxy-D-xylulose 5-phosphate reductoisomerase